MFRKTIHWLWLAWFVACLLPSCTPRVPTGVLQQESGMIVRPHFEKGDRYTVTRTMSEKMAATDSPQGDWTMANEIERTWNMEVKKKKRSGESIHTGTLDRLKVIYDMAPTGVQEFNSETNSSGPMSAHFKKYVDGAYTFAYAPDYRLLAVEASPSLMEQDMFKAVEGYSAAAWTSEKYQLESVFPDTIIAATQPWSQSPEVQSFYPMVFDLDYTLYTDQADDWVLKMTGTAAPHPAPIATNEMGFRITYALKGTVSGAYRVDPQTGRLLSGRHTVDATGTCLMLLPDSSEVSFPVTLSQSETSRYVYQ